MSNCLNSTVVTALDSCDEEVPSSVLTPCAVKSWANRHILVHLLQNGTTEKSGDDSKLEH